MKRGSTPFLSKLRPDMQPDVQDGRRGMGRMLLPTPLLLAEQISAIPAGQVRTLSSPRSDLAARFGADVTCPMMSGIFFNLIAGAVEEEIAAGRAPMAPYWRVVVDERGTLSLKTPDGPERQVEHLRQEGHRVEQERSRWRVISSPA